MSDTTVEPAFPDDELSRGLRRVVRLAGLLEPHDHIGLDVSLSEVIALAELAEVEAVSQQALADLLALEKSTISRLAAGLERRGWLARQRDPANRRYYRLGLTPEGRDVARRIGAELHERHAVLLGAMTAEERAALTLGLTALGRAVDAAEARHGLAPGSRY